MASVLLELSEILFAFSQLHRSLIILISMFLYRYNSYSQRRGCNKNKKLSPCVPPISKIFENFLQKQIYSHVEITYHHFYVDIGKDIQHNMLFFL